MWIITEDEDQKKGVLMAPLDIHERLERMEKAIDKILRFIENKGAGDFYMSASQTAIYVGLKKSTIIYYKKEIGYIKRSKIIMFSKKDIDNWMRHSRRAPTIGTTI